jgi:hypothetical protein
VSVMAVAKFERFFRRAASLDVDKSDLKRYSDFINRKIYDLLLRAQAAARANARSIIEPFDLPITKGLQESIQDFRKLDEEIELQPILRFPYRSPAARSRLQRGYGGAAPVCRRRLERGARPCLQDHRS